MLQLPHVFEIADLEERREKASNLLKVRVRVRLRVRVRVRVNQRETASTLLTLTLTALKGFTTLLHDDTAMLNMGMDSKPSLEDKLYMVEELHRFNGDVEKAMDLMKNVADIQKLHEDLGHPTRMQVIVWSEVLSTLA